MIKPKEEVGPDREERIIMGLKNDYLIQTGRHIKIETCSRWESTANFTFRATIGQVVKMVFDFTGWKWEDTYVRGVPGARSAEKIYRRGTIDYLAVNNGCTLNECARFTERANVEGFGHWGVIESVKKFEQRLETDPYVKRSFMEIVNFCRDNFHLYKNRDYTKEQIIEEGKSEELLEK